MSKSSTNTGTPKPVSTNNGAVKPTISRPTSNTNVNMEYRGGTPSFTKKSKQSV